MSDNTTVDEVIDAFLKHTRIGSLQREVNQTPPEEVLAEFKRLRLGALRLPQRLGGYGLNLTDYFRFLIAHAAADVNSAHIPRLHGAFVERLVVADPEEITHPIASRIAAGDLIIGFGTGRNVPIDTLRLEQDGSDWYATGKQFYRTGGKYSDWVLLNGADNTGEERRFLIPADRNGISFPDDWHGIGQRLTATGSIELDRVQLAAIEEVPARSYPQPTTDHATTFHQLYLSALIAGVLQRAQEDISEYVKGRHRGFPHANHPEARHDPQVHEVLGRVAAGATAAKWIVLGAATDLAAAVTAARRNLPDAPDTLTEAVASIAKAKVVVEDLGLRGSSDIFEVGGASSTDAALLLDRHWRNIRTISTHNPTIYKARFIGDHILNDSAPPTVGAF